VNYLIYFCSVILPWLSLVGLVVYFILTKKKIAAVRTISLALIGAFLAWILASLYKYNMPAPRPFEVLSNIKPLFIPGRGESFPSDHAVFFSTLGFLIFYQNRRLGLIFLLSALVIGATRVLAGVHWPVDILAGFGFGFIFSLVAYWVAKKLIFNGFLL